MNTTDTIAAVASGVGGAVAVVRLSGPEALAVASRVWSGKGLGEAVHFRRMLLGRVGGEPVLAVYMPGPASYTGDDVVELQCHGGPMPARKLLGLLLEAGARLAEPGEFTQRAFLNGKMDLTQAEAVADLVAARHSGALVMAERQLEGHLGRLVRQCRAQLVDQLSELESRLDFPDETLDWRSLEETLAATAHLRTILNELAAEEKSGRIWREGVTVVLAGRPNSGKSSLMNRLLGRDRAIVTEIAGTTRDTLEESVVLRRIPVVLVDTAGLRDAENPVEALGVERSRRALAEARIVLWLLDAAGDVAAEAAELAAARLKTPVIAVWNKTDLIAADAALPETGFPTVRISVHSGEGLDGLLDAVEREVWREGESELPEVAVNLRHAEQLRSAVSALDESVAPLTAGQWEVAAVFWRQAMRALGIITGESADPDLLDRIFSRFCIGK